MKNPVVQKIYWLIQEKQLTSLLEILESYGYIGDTAILMLGYIQTLGVAE